MTDQADLLPGSLDLLIPKAVSLGKLHEYGVLLGLDQPSGGALQVPEGALHPRPYRLEHQGLIESEWGMSENDRRANFFRLATPDPQRRGEGAASWNTHAEAMALALPASPQELG